MASRKLKKTILTIFAGLGLTLLLVGLGVGLFLLRKYQAGLTNTAGKVDFAQAMPVPPLAQPTIEADGTRTFKLRMQEGTTEFFPGKQTKTWGFNGQYLGPTIRASEGQKVRIEVKNALSETSSVHWHGMHLPAAMDGGPHQPVAAGGTWSPEWTIRQQAATLWYHPHPHGETEQHIYNGLAGMFIVDDDDNPASLPHTYGTDDLPVIIQDKQFTDDKQLVYGSAGPTGSIGKEIIVNGVRTPHITAPSEKMRLRLLNASSGRIYNLGLTNNDSMQLIASDGGLLEAPVNKDRLVLSPGERAEVIISLMPGERVTLRSYPQRLAGGLGNRYMGGDDTLDILQIRAADSLSEAPAVPGILAATPAAYSLEGAVVRRFDLTSDSTINGKQMDMNRIDFASVRGQAEIWEITNKDGGPHNFHIHDTQFRVLTIAGKEPPPELQGRKDTVLIKQGETVRLAVRFEDYTSTSLPYMYHCHLLRHEDKGMMGQFVVVEEGQKPSDAVNGMGHSHTH